MINIIIHYTAVIKDFVVFYNIFSAHEHLKDTLVSYRYLVNCDPFVSWFLLLH